MKKKSLPQLKSKEMIELNKIYFGDCLEVLNNFPDESVNCCVTSPPYYGLRDYGVDEQIGLEDTPELYVKKLVRVFQEVKRILKQDGTLWLNLGDSYAGSGQGYGDTKTTNKGHTGSRQRRKPQWRSSDPENTRNGEWCNRNGLGNIPNLKPKDLIGIPWMVAFALRADGWYLRQDIIWAKPNPMPESVTDRCTKSHEYIFLLSKSSKYYYDQESIYEKAKYDGRKDIIMKGSKKYQNGYFPTDVNTQSIAVKGHVRWKTKNHPIGNKNIHPANECNPKTKMEGTGYGGDGNGLHGHSGYDCLDNPYIRNKRDVWTVCTTPYSEAHFATFPELLISDCIKAGCPENGIVIDPFIGAGTTGLVARKLNRNYVGIELNPEYVKIAEKRIFNEIGLFNETQVTTTA